MKKIVITQSITNTDSETFKKYLSDISNYPILNDKEELMYAERARNGDKKAMELLISCNLRFVVSVAKQYISKDSKLPDLVNEGNMGLIKAAEKFDFTKGFKFISFAVWWIRNYIIEYKNNQAKMIRLPLHKISDMTKIQKRYYKLEQEFNREPSVDELFISFNNEFTIEDIESCLRLIHSNEESLDEVRDDGTSLSDNLASYLPESDHLLIEADDKEWFDNLFSVLSDQEKYILTKLFGLDGGAQIPLESIGDEIGMTREGVRQIREKSLRKIRNNIKLKQHER